MWKDKSKNYLRGNMTRMTEVKHDLIVRSTFVRLWTKTHFVVLLNESVILHVLHIRYQETR